MRDLVLSLLIGTTIIVGATETVGLTHFTEGQDPSGAVRRAVHDMGVPDLPAMPEISIPDPRSFLPTSSAASPTPTGTPISGPPDSRPDVKTMFIAHTNGAGVRARATCADTNLGTTGVAEGAMVEFIRAGGGECPGWGLVRSGTLEFWVRMAYLDGSPPRAVAPNAQGGSVAAPAPPPDNANVPSKAPPAQAEQDSPHGKSEDKGQKPQLPETPPPTSTPTSTAAPTPTAAATASPTPSPTPPPSPTPLPNLPPEDEQ